MWQPVCERCGQRVFFQNDVCLACDTALVFDPALWRMVGIVPDGQGGWLRLTHGQPGEPVRPCAHRARGLCNWACSQPGDTLCLACGLTHERPGDGDALAQRQWAEAELAKRRLLVQLRERGLPVWAQDGPPPMSFDFLTPRQSSTPVLTGHAQGRITLNLDEVDAVHRVQVQSQFSEPYRSVLGHLRHESGHFYWDQLIAPNEALLQSFRALFGDERRDYGQALADYHARSASGEPMTAPDTHISHYASAHPWEDWAETWAHDFMLLDAMQAHDPAVIQAWRDGRCPHAQLLEAWQEAAVQLNAVSRALGLPDAYPFVLTEPVRRKLIFVDQAIRQQAISR